MMPQKTPDTLEFFRTELKKLERAPEPTMDPIAVVDLKRLLVVRIAELETDRAIHDTMDTQNQSPTTKSKDAESLQRDDVAWTSTLTITIEHTELDVHRLK
jgi:hypothetical protein